MSQDKHQESNLVPQLVSGSDLVYEDAGDATSGMVPHHDVSFLKLVHVSRQGLSYAKFKIAMEAFQLSKQVLASLLHISERTLDRIHKEKKRLSTPQTERVLELSLLYEHGWACFGDQEAFRDWLETSYFPYGGVTPLSLLDTSQGIKMVHTALGRIEHGITA